MGFAHCLLMVTEDSHLPIRLIVRSDLLYHRSILWCPILKLLFEGDGGIIRSEDFRRETLHVRGEVLVDCGRLMQHNLSVTTISREAEVNLTVTRSNIASPTVLGSFLNSRIFLYTC